MKRIVTALVIWACLLQTAPAPACTVTLTGKDASADGSVMVSHSDDGLGDPRLIHVPAMRHKPGALRPVFYSHCALGYKPEWGASETKRIVTRDRGPGYETPGVPSCVPVGHIPQVTRTYAYFDANYGLMNEHQLSIGECTDKAKVHPEPELGQTDFLFGGIVPGGPGALQDRPRGRQADGGVDRALRILRHRRNPDRGRSPGGLGHGDVRVRHERHRRGLGGAAGAGRLGFSWRPTSFASGKSARTTQT